MLSNIMYPISSEAGPGNRQKYLMNNAHTVVAIDIYIAITVIKLSANDIALDSACPNFLTPLYSSFPNL